LSTSQLPWPSAALVPAGWAGVRRLLARCLELHAAAALPGTLMVVGAPGLGREALALELAAALICRQGKGAGCRCGSCERARRGVHPDLEILVVAPDKKEITIEQSRRVVESVDQRPYEGMRRVWVLDSCQTPPLNSEAASALLKTLEEPSAQATFLLLAGNPARVLPTIVSRSVQLRVPPPTPEELISVIASAQGCTPDRAEALLAAAGGDAELVLRANGEDLAGALAGLEDLLSKALAGDSLAILRAASSLRQTPGGVALAAAALLRLASRAAPGEAEGFLDAVAALLTEENRRAVLHLDAESVVVGALTRAVRRHPAAGKPTP